MTAAKDSGSPCSPRPHESALSIKMCVFHKVSAYHCGAILGLLESRAQGSSMRLGPKSCAVLLVAALFVGGVSGQTTSSGALSGVVIDKTNAVVPDAGVKITDLAKGTTQSIKTDREGLYRFFFLAPGRYTLVVTHAGFEEAERTVDVLLGPAITVNVSLEVATANSEIRVSDEVPLLQAES